MKLFLFQCLCLYAFVLATCPPGETVSMDGSKCEKCFKYSFKEKAGAGPCLPCPPNGFARPGSARCKICPPGEVLLKNGKCGKCPAGSRLDLDLRCKPCRIEYFMPYEDIKDLHFPCAGSTFSNRGAKECIKCQQNKVLFRNGVSRPCPKGHYYSKFRLPRCMKCARNRYRAEPGALEYCEECPPNTYALRGSSTCFGCPNGTTLIAKTGKCGVCPAGTRYSRTDSNCRKCTYNTFTSSPGILEDCFKCYPGNKANAANTKCIPE